MAEGLLIHIGDTVGARATHAPAVETWGIAYGNVLERVLGAPEAVDAAAAGLLARDQTFTPSAVATELTTHAARHREDLPRLLPCPSREC